MENEELFEFLVTQLDENRLNYLISEFVPLTENQIKIFGFNKISSYRLKHNGNIIWTDDSIRLYSRIWSINELIGVHMGYLEKNRNLSGSWTNKRDIPNTQVYISERILNEFQNEIDWDYISLFPNLPWSFELLKTYEHKWNWDRISINSSIPFNTLIVHNFWSKLNFTELLKLDLPWLENLLKDKGLLNHYKKQMQASQEFINKTPYNRYIRGLPRDSSLWTEEIIEKNKDVIDWQSLSKVKSIPWDLDFIRKFESKISWLYLSNNTGVTFNLKILNEFSQKWDFECLSDNPSLKIEFELLSNFEDKWDWKALSYGADRDQFDIKVLYEYADRLCWDNISANTNIHWDYHLIDDFQYRINWKLLSQNPSLEFSSEILEEFGAKLNSTDLIVHNKKYHNKEFITKYKDNIRWKWVGHEIDFLYPIFLKELSESEINSLLYQSLPIKKNTEFSDKSEDYLQKYYPEEYSKRLKIKKQFNVNGEHIVFSQIIRKAEKNISHFLTEYFELEDCILVKSIYNTNHLDGNLEFQKSFKAKFSLEGKMLFQF